MAWHQAAVDNLARNPRNIPRLEPALDVSAHPAARNQLKGADLSGASLIAADMSRATLHGATLREADLRGASLGRADLFRAILSGAGLRAANLEGANLMAAVVANEQLAQTACLGGTTLPDGTMHE